METTNQRVLCSWCMQSFAAEEVEAVDGELCCRGCRERSATRTEKPVAAVPESPQRVGESPGFGRRLYQEMESWCVGRLWWARLPLWLYFAYGLARHWVQPGEYRSIFDALNLGIHELGHVVFRPLGEFMTAAGGTILQCLAPVLSGVMFYRQRDFFAIAVSFCWLATNLWGVALYAGDARALELQLVAPGHGVLPRGEGHDWNYMLGRFAMLRWDTTIEWILRLLATGVMLGGLALGAWLMWRMLRQPAKTLTVHLD